MYSFVRRDSNSPENVLQRRIGTIDWNRGSKIQATDPQKLPHRRDNGSPSGPLDLPEG
jgi:hypothetical protein